MLMIKIFKPLVDAREPGSIEEFVELTGGVITQTAALCAIREMIPSDAIVVGASGSLPGDLQRMWTTQTRDSYHMEYGYSCMGYEIAAALGAKLAAPDREVYAMTGDGSYLMLHTELVTSLQEGKKKTYSSLTTAVSAVSTICKCQRHRKSGDRIPLSRTGGKV
jgi:3D-(3,5/4)-trihydroxycyclohexane-1,2-dione acylhydrolase (decyclizing)